MAWVSINDATQQHGNVFASGGALLGTGKMANYLCIRRSIIFVVSLA